VCLGLRLKDLMVNVQRLVICDNLRHLIKFLLLLLFFTQGWTPHILRFDFIYTVIIPAAPQETVEEAGDRNLHLHI
jgi:hypothetical protein